jgi:transcriptional regulator with XRE-family HTH domain
MTNQRKPNGHATQLRAQLRLLRDKAGLTQDEAGTALGGSRYQVHRLETSRVPVYDELLAVLAVYEVPAEKRAALAQLWELAWEPGGHRVRSGRLGGGSKRQ